jgi:cytochrome c oxidase cbb3-type subunit IV
MTYDEIRSFAGVGGLLLFMALFAAVLIYTFWPGNKKSFEEARNIPLEDDKDDSPSRGENGR